MIDGSDTHKTCLGAFLSLIVYVFFLIYSSSRTIEFINKDNTEYKTKMFEDDLDTEKTFTNDELGVELIFYAHCKEYNQWLNLGLDSLIDIDAHIVEENIGKV